MKPIGRKAIEAACERKSARAGLAIGWLVGAGLCALVGAGLASLVGASPAGGAVFLCSAWVGWAPLDD